MAYYIKSLYYEQKFLVSRNSLTVLYVVFPNINALISYLSPAPSAPVTSLNATTLSAASIVVEWDELLYKERNGDLLGYHVMYWRNAEDSRIHTEVVPSLAETGRVSVELFRLQPYTSYSIQVAAANSDGTGQSSDIPSVLTHEDCKLYVVLTN